TTRLGDCKDVSSLFVALAGKAGLKAQLVLVDTRDNGTRDMVLPSVSFNHCIVKAMINGKDYYLELTDRNLPFGSHPTNLYQALSLDIPAMGQSGKDVGLKPLVAENRTLDQVNTTLKVKVDGRNLQFDVQAQRKGHLTSDWRQGYATTSPADLHKDIQQSISGSYKNPVKLNAVKFIGLDDLGDSVTLDYSYSVKNEVIEAGSMKMIRIPLLDVVASIDNLSLDNRQFPLEYWRYENTDVYESNITVELQPGQKFLEVPEDQSFTFNKSSYQIKYTRVGDALKVRRYARLDRGNVLPADYEKFKKFFNDIIEAESKYIVFK
ncbi:MAG TPA: transglutaminase domain-containing protein, partial [Flavisolibacter sp.]